MESTTAISLRNFTWTLFLADFATSGTKISIYSERERKREREREIVR
jgi:hypothetical protein